MVSFVVDLHLPNSMLAKIFKDRLISSIRDRVSMQRLRRFKDVVEAALIT